MVCAAGETFTLPVVGRPDFETLSIHDAWSTQSLRDRMVRRDGMGVLQDKSGCLLVLNDKKIKAKQLHNLSFCLQL